MTGPEDRPVPEFALVGAHGMLGRAWRERLEAQRRDYIAYGRHQLDITDPAAVDAKLPAGLRFVVNCAAYTDVDACETHEADATRLNALGPGHLARRCAAIHATLLHYSTDYVFAGDADTPYPVDAPIAPRSAYGRTKAAGEQAVRDAAGPHLILRTSWLYAPWGQNFVRTMLRLTAEKDRLRVVHDQRGRPTSAPRLADVSLQLADLHDPSDPGQTLHVTDAGECTWFEFTQEIARRAGPPASACDLQPCTTAEFPRPAPRPAYSVLDLAPTQALVGPLTDWRDNLADVLATLRESPPA
ncbi:MAG: dTDP-4-dehydrorhamnose reductase [Planctomycetota bacterium]